MALYSPVWASQPTSSETIDCTADLSALTVDQLSSRAELCGKEDNALLQTVGAAAVGVTLATLAATAGGSSGGAKTPSAGGGENPG
ncbi:hypothetical protein INF73_01650, partial [Enterobacter cloacae complex sp. P6RS]|uniref:hypothetical protein n=2 Tax=unclassified Enterobacter cloacae complex TaxID=2757714 RepID=UPI001875ED70